MGCRGSKEDGDEGGTGVGKNGESKNNPGGPSGTTLASVDQRIPMTAKQKYSIVASWKGIHRAMEPTGIFMFVK